MITNPSIPKTSAAWGILLACLGLLLAAALLPPIPKAKARPQRIQTVNTLQSVTVALPATNGQLDPGAN